MGAPRPRSEGLSPAARAAPFAALRAPAPCEGVPPALRGRSTPETLPRVPHELAPRSIQAEFLRPSELLGDLGGRADLAQPRQRVADRRVVPLVADRGG